MKHLFTFLTALCLMQTVNAQWITDSTTRNPICTAASTQRNQQLCSDGNKGAYIVWEDYRKTPAGIYIQHIDSGGHTTWQQNGIVVSDTTEAASSVPQVVPDGKGGVIVVWEQGIISNGDHLDATRLDRSGHVVWKDPITHIASIYDNRNPQVVADGHGGVAINWFAYTTYYGDPVMFQWIDSTGRSILPANGIIISTNQISEHYTSYAAVDNNYHAIIAYNNYDTLIVQRVDTTGKLSFGNKGKIVSTTFHLDGSYPGSGIISDGNYGAILGWEDTRFNALVPVLIGQRIDSSGNFKWGQTNLVVDSSTARYYNHANISIKTDENHGAYFCFGTSKVLLQHINAGGKLSWPKADSVSVKNLFQNYPSMDEDGYNGVVVSWDDSRTGVYGGTVYAQEIDSNGVHLWSADDAPVYTGANSGSATGTKILSLRNHKAIAATQITVGDIYAARVPDRPAIIITGVEEVMNTSSLSAFPNPTPGNLYIKNNAAAVSDGLVQLFDVTGKLVYQQAINLPANAQQAINIPAAAKGLYLLKISTGTEQNISKLIIE